MSKLRNELDKLSGLIVGKNVLQSPLDFWGRYDVWRDVTKGLESAIREMEEKMERLTHERVNGIKTGYWSPEKKETLVNALAEYENTGLTPEEIKMLNGKGADAPANDGWISAKVTPPPMDGQRLQAIIKHHEWITDYDADWVPEEEKIRHPEYLEVCEIHNIGATWFYACKEDDYQNDVAYIDPLKDLANPVSEIIAWQPLPEPYRPGKE